ncbi:MAG: sialidase family protein, partial [FCB group bacterium]|nr:sialidase family protein [FCB group bacterium]
VLEPPAESKSGLQEPGLIELKDGRLMMLMRTDQGCQMRSFSSDGGDTWSPAETTGILSPVSPATLARIPGTEELVMVWNDHSKIDPALKGKRTPLTLAISADEGKTWERRVDIETSPTGWYCYTAIHFTDKAMLLGYCAGNTEQENGLARTRIRRIPLDQLPQKK